MVTGAVLGGWNLVSRACSQMKIIRLTVDDERFVGIKLKKTKHGKKIDEPKKLEEMIKNHIEEEKKGSLGWLQFVC